MVALAAMLAFLAVAFGAFGAHGLRKYKTPEQLTVFQTGVHYQMVHAIAMLVIGSLVQYVGVKNTDFSIALWLFFIGILLFSGSLYAITFTAIRKFGAITPLGGLCFLAGWFFVMLYAIR